MRLIGMTCGIAPSRGPAVVRGGLASHGSRASLIIAISLLSAATGCASSDTKSDKSTARPPGVLSSLNIVATPPGGIALYTPILTIPSGSDQTYCTYTDITLTDDLFVHTTRGSQSSMGHHALLFYAPTPQTPGTALCSGQSMEQLRQLIGGSGGEGTTVYEPPPEVGVLIPKGSQLVLQSHWINTSDAPVDVQAMMVTEPGQTGSNRIEAGTVALVDLGFTVPAGGSAQSGVDCTFQDEHRLLMSIGHEHEWGTHVRAELLRASGASELLFDRPFSPHDVFDPPINGYSVDQPLDIGVGDTIKMSCEWMNTTTDPLTFPREMCVFFGFSMEAGDARCINGGWGGGGGDGGSGISIPGPACVPAGATGNEIGVGKYCTQGGNECTGNGSATMCLADYVSGDFADFCFRLCSTDADCGSGATCTGSGSSPSACFPTSCTGSADGGSADGGSADGGSP